MPEVKPGESRSDYMARCVPQVIQEGANRDAAVGKCEGMYDSHHKKKAVMTCDAAQLFGEWAIEPEAHQRLFDLCIAIPMEEVMKMGEKTASKEPPEPYTVNGRTAVIEMNGPLTKKPHSFDPLVGGGSTVRARDALRKAELDSRVDRILMSIDSPGGTAAGTRDLHDAIKRTDKAKPVYTHFNDVGGSAAYWIGSAGRQVSANANAQVGSIGAYTVLRDVSGLREKNGIKLHVIASGKFKGAGENGLTEEQKAHVQERIDALAGLFMQDVAANRKLPLDKVREIGDGRVFIASKAKELGLIDKVCSQEELIDELNSKSVGSTQTGQQPRSNVMPYTQEQLAKARSLPSLASVTDEGAEVAVLNAAVNLNSRVNELSQQVGAKDTEIVQLRGQLPPQMDPSVLQGFAELADGQIDLMASKGKILPGQVTQLKAMVRVNGQPNAKMLVGIAGAEAPYKSVLKAFEDNQPNGLVSEKTGGQPVPRTEPGASGEQSKDQWPTYERWNQLRAAAGQQPGTKEQYENAKMGIV